MAIYMWREQGGWQPGANTLVYYDFEDDTGTTIKNKAGTGTTYDGTYYTTPSYGTTSAGKKYFECNTSNYGYTPVVPFNYNSVTMVIRIYFPAYDAERRIFGTERWVDYNGPQTAINQYNLNLDPITCGGTAPNSNRMTVSYPQTGWHLLVLRNDGVTQSAWLDGAFWNSTGGSSGINGSNIGIGTVYTWRSQTNRLFKGNFGTLIIENVVRTDQEVQDYYDQTKTLYGIS